MQKIFRNGQRYLSAIFLICSIFTAQICTAQIFSDNSYRKLDSQAADGLSGVFNSTAYRIHETERHLHSFEWWFEAAAVPDAETHIADRIGANSGTPFVPDAGNDDWGTWLQIYGSDDSPCLVGNVKFDIHRLLLAAQERNNTVYFIQVGFGASGAAALAANTYTELPIKTGGGNSVLTPINIQTDRQDVGTKVWIRLKVPGQDTGTLSFFFGLHEYEG